MFFTTKYRSDLMTKMIIEGPTDPSEHSLQGWFVKVVDSNRARGAIFMSQSTEKAVS